MRHTFVCYLIFWKKRTRYWWGSTKKDRGFLAKVRSRFRDDLPDLPEPGYPRQMASVL